MTTTYIGIVDGLHTWAVCNEAGDLIGTNQSPHPPCPGEGWTLDVVANVWVEEPK
jgi:hypothetical protein